MSVLWIRFYIFKGLKKWIRKEINEGLTIAYVAITNDILVVAAKVEGIYSSKGNRTWFVLFSYCLK